MTRYIPILFAAILFTSGCSPVCVLYPTHCVPVPVLDVPQAIFEPFSKHCPNTKLVSVNKQLGGKTGTELIMWIFRFEQDGKLREALIHKPHDPAPFIYDVQK